MISIAKYRRITLQIPACDACAARHWLWFGVARQMLRQRAHHEGEHSLVRKPLMIALGIVAVPFLMVTAIVQHHGR